MSPTSAAASLEINKRFQWFLLCQFIHPIIIHIFYRALISLFVSNFFFFTFSLRTLFFSLTFHLSLLHFSYSLSTISSPIIGLGGQFPNSYPPSFRSRIKTCLGFINFLIDSAILGSISVVSLCGSTDLFSGFELIGLGCRGYLFGYFYGVHYVDSKRWVLSFPIIQPPYFSFKMGYSSLRKAIILSSWSFVYSLVVVFLPDKYYKSKGTIWKSIGEHAIFYVGSIAVSLCWELSHHLHQCMQVLHTKRFVFAPPIGSAADETNPSEPLLAVLEEKPSQISPTISGIS